MKITLSGDPGSGKSTIRPLIAKELGLTCFSAGDLADNLATKRGMTLIEFFKKGETDPSVDKAIDDETRRVFDSQNDFILDGHIAWYFASQDAFKVFLKVNSWVGAQRIYKDRLAGNRIKEPLYTSVQDAFRHTQELFRINTKRWKETYGIADRNSPEHYDLVIDTTDLTVAQVVERIIVAARAHAIALPLRPISVTTSSLNPKTTNTITSTFTSPPPLKKAQAPPLAMPIKKNDFIEVDYTGKVKDTGDIFDSTDPATVKNLNARATTGPCVICVGEGQLLQGIDDYLIGKEIGTYTITLLPDRAFGKKDASLVRLVPLARFAKENFRPTPGLRVNVDGRMATIRSTSGGRVLMDYNHPLAGKEVEYTLTARRVVMDPAEQVRGWLKLSLGVETTVTIKDKTATVSGAPLPAPLATEIAKKLAALTGLATIEFKAAETTQKA